jgi:hypothetical protein
VQDVTGEQLQRGGAALTNLGAHLTDIAARTNEEHALATSKGGLNKWSEYADGIDQDYRSTLGKAASEIDGIEAKPGEAPNKVVERMEEKMREIEDGLSNDLAKRIFRQHAERYMVTYHGRLHAHESKQIRIHKKAEDAATLGRFAKNYVVNGDPADFKGAMDTAREISDDAGHGSEARKAYLLETKTALHTGYVKALLENEDLAGADEYLRGLERDEIDVVVRQKLRAQINGVMKAEKSKRGAFKIFDNQGYASEQEMRNRAAARLPAAERNKIMSTAVAEVAKERGLLESAGLTVEEFMRVPGDWSHLLTDPEVMAKVQEKVSSLDDDILFARYPGQPPANDPESGSYKRMLDRVKAMFDRDEIDAEQREQMERHIDQLVNRRTRVEAVAAQESLEQVEEIFQRTRTGAGELTSVYSSEFRTQHPDLFEELRDRGLLASADKLATGVLTRRSNPGYRDQMHRDAASGAFERMSFAQLYEKYYPNLDSTDWNEAKRLWAPFHEGGNAKIANDPVVKWETELKHWLAARGKMSDQDNNGVPRPNSDAERQEWNRLQHDLNQAVQRSGQTWTNEDVIKWATERETAKVFTRVERGWYNPAWWFGDSHTTEPARAADVEAKIRDAEMKGDQDLADSIRESRRFKINGRDVGLKADGLRVLVVDEEPVPTRATDYIRDLWRMEWLKDQLGPTSMAYREALEKLNGTGAFSPHATRNEHAIDKVFDGLGVPAWPGPVEQTNYWMRFKGLYPKVEPRRPAQRYGTRGGISGNLPFGV